MTPSDTVSIVILNYNGKEHLDDCLRSIDAMTFPRDRLEVVLADNGSTDGSIEHVRARFPSVEIHAHGENLGFSGGNDRSARTVRGDRVAFLNNDVRVDPGWLEPLVEALDANPDVACAGSHVLDFAGERVLYAGSSLHFTGFGYQTGMGEPMEGHPAEGPPRETLFATGCAMLARRDSFLRFGGFDEDFFAYYEDVDLGWRFWVTGERVLYVPGSVVYHKGDASFAHSPSERKQHLWNRNVLWAMVKNYEEEHLAKLLPVALLLTIERALYFLDVEGLEQTQRVHALFPGLSDEEAVERRVAVGMAHLRALRDVTLGLPGMLEKRRAIQAVRGRSDADLFRRFPLELDFRDQVNEVSRQSLLCRLLPLLDCADLIRPERVDAPLARHVGQLESACESYRRTVDLLQGEIGRRAESLEHWISETKKLNAEVTRLAPLEAELRRIQSKRWFRAIETLRRWRARLPGGRS